MAAMIKQCLSNACIHLLACCFFSHFQTGQTLSHMAAIGGHKHVLIHLKSLNQDISLADHVSLCKL